MNQKEKKILTQEEVAKFILEVPDHKFLMIKVMRLFVSGVCRRQELKHNHIDNKDKANETQQETYFHLCEERNHLQLIRKCESLRP